METPFSFRHAGPTRTIVLRVSSPHIYGSFFMAISSGSETMQTLYRNHLHPEQIEDKPLCCQDRH